MFEEIRVEKDNFLLNEKGELKDKEGRVIDFLNKIVEFEELGDKGIFFNMES